MGVASPELHQIQMPEGELRAFCERNHIQLLALFGSVIRDDFTETSDVDMLVEFEPDHVPGFQFFTIQAELSEILGREVDLNTPGFLGPHMRDVVQNEAVILYVKT